MNALDLVVNLSFDPDSPRLHTDANNELVQLRKDLEDYSNLLRDAEKLIVRIFEMADNGTSAIDIDPSSPLWQIEADTRAWIERNNK